MFSTRAKRNEKFYVELCRQVCVIKISGHAAAVMRETRLARASFKSDGKEHDRERGGGKERRRGGSWSVAGVAEEMTGRSGGWGEGREAGGRGGEPPHAGGFREMNFTDG